MDDLLAEELTAGEALAREGGWGPIWTMYLARHLVASGALPRAGAILAQMVRDGVPDTDDRWIVEFLRGEVALAERRVPDAVASLEAADQLRSGSFTKEALGRAYQASGALEASAEAFRELIRLMPLGWEAQDPWVLAHYRLGVVYQELGDAERAREYLGRFLEIWGSGDDDLEGVVDARKRLGG